MASNNTISLPNAASTRLLPEKSSPDWAYVTLLAGNGDDWMGVQGLAVGLKKVKSMYPLVVAILPDVPEEHRRILQDLGCVVKEIQPVYQLKKYVQLASEFPYVAKYSKLFIWKHVLNMFFRKSLSAFPGYIYGALTMVDEEKNIDHLEKVKVIRYSSPELRPWRRTPKMGNVDFVNKLKRKWKDICPGRSLDSEKLKIVKTEKLLNFSSASGTK
ncbi:hypothetical protein SLEP1_g14006 [Rubroshorea leprosula]|uniref:Hexosyltransferase n=1 Tax=Rubroshorea leprosula TaxID=152421 RepID=A0AAV5IRH9_9ROSI|nr:hypothetical protein SLEP1_g14006 [Rubroshorea leprosula]